MLLIQFIYFTGLLFMARQDAISQSVSARLTDGWLALVLSGTLVVAPSRLLAMFAVSLVLTLFAYRTRGLGSADIFVLAGSVCCLGLTGTLCTLTVASVSGLLWAHKRQQQQIAFIPHLAFGAVTYCLFLASFLHLH